MKIDPQAAIMQPSALTRTGQQAATEEEQRLREKCREFEAILLQKMVEVMQGDTNLFGQGIQENISAGCLQNSSLRNWRGIQAWEWPIALSGL